MPRFPQFVCRQFNKERAGRVACLPGRGTTRENVQRLGRILRKYGDKQALLYEVVARGTAEEFTSERRGQHTAFQ